MSYKENVARHKDDPIWLLASYSYFRGLWTLFRESHKGDPSKASLLDQTRGMAEEAASALLALLLKREPTPDEVQQAVGQE